MTHPVYAPLVLARFYLKKRFTTETLRTRRFFFEEKKQGKSFFLLCALRVVAPQDNVIALELAPIP
ncbi:MAG: hypothetical protein JXQ72_11270, partial [Anaerolineae bacterium]|nr:hypothetical protein [Anaerolineae bacterium]